MNDHSGINEQCYVYDDQKVKVSSHFIYEICLYKYWKNGFCILGSKLYKSNKLLNINKYREYNYSKKYIIEREITLIAVPYDFVKENDLPTYKPYIINKKSRKKK